MQDWAIFFPAASSNWAKNGANWVGQMWCVSGGENIVAKDRIRVYNKKGFFIINFFFLFYLVVLPRVKGQFKFTMQNPPHDE